MSVEKGTVINMWAQICIKLGKCKYLSNVLPNIIRSASLSMLIYDTIDLS